jgi:hypothetical protein
LPILPSPWTRVWARDVLSVFDYQVEAIRPPAASAAHDIRVGVALQGQHGGVLRSMQGRQRRPTWKDNPLTVEYEEKAKNLLKAKLKRKG